MIGIAFALFLGTIEKNLEFRANLRVKCVVREGLLPQVHYFGRSSTPESVEPRVRKWYTAKPILLFGLSGPPFIAGGSHGRQELANPGSASRQHSWRPRDRCGMHGFDAHRWEAPGASVLAKAAAARILSDPDTT